jgi:hypothetical protein
MTIKNDVAPAGTGQEGAASPAGAKENIPVHIEGEPVDKLEELANRAAHKGLDRQHSDDATIFTK